MASRIKWWINGIAAFIFVMLCIIYLLIRPIITQNLEPVIKDAAGERINGTLTWTMMDLDPNYDLSFTDLELKDAKGEVVFKSPSLAIGWSASALYNYAFKDGGIADVVKTVTIEDPEVHLSKSEDGLWNVEKILKPSDSSDNGTFTGQVIVKDGKASISAPDIGSYDFTSLGGTLGWDSKGTITGSFAGEAFDSHFTGDLKYTNTNNMEISLETDPVSLTSLKPLLEQFPQISSKLDIDKGTGQVTSAKIWKSDGAVAYHVQGSIKDAALRYDHFILADGAAFFDIENGEAVITEAAVKVNGQTFTGDAKVLFDVDDPILMGHVTLKDIKAEELLPEKGATGVVSGSVDISGTMGDPFVSGEAHVKDGQYEDLSVKEANVRFVYGEDRISIPYLKAQMAGGLLIGEGSYTMTSGAFEGEAAGEHIDLSSLPVGISASGIVSGSGKAKGTYKEGALSLEMASGEMDGAGLSYENMAAGKVSGFGSYRDGDWHGVFYGMDLSYDGMSMDTLSGEATSRGGVMDIAYLTGTSGEGAFTVKGTYGPSLSLSGEVSSIDLSALSGLSGMDMAGRLSGRFVVSGSREDPYGAADFTAQDGEIRGISFDRIEGHVSLGDQLATITSLRWEGPDGKHTVKGTVGLFAPHPLTLTIDTDKTRIEKLLALAGEDYPVTGWVENTMTVTGTMEAPQVKGDFLAFDGSVMGELFQSISGEYTYDGNDITLKNGLAYIYDGTAIVSGTVKPDMIDMDVALNDISLSRMLPGRGADGKVNMRGHVSGTMEDPVFEGTISSRQISVGGTAIYMASAGIYYQNHVVSLDDGIFDQKNGHFEWRGSYHMDSHALQGFLRFKEWNIKEIMRLFKLPESAVDGAVNGGMQIGGTLENPSIDFKADFLGGHLGDTPVGQGAIDFSYINGALSIRKFHLPVGDGLLAAEGSMNSDGELAIQIAAKDMEMSWLPQVLGRDDIRMGGRLTAGVVLSGNKTSPEADISIGIEHPSYGEISFDSFSLMANAKSNVVTLQNALVSKGNYRASAKGILPGNLFTGSTTDEAVPLSVDFNLDQADMNILALFGKAVTSASGPIKGHVQLVGDYRDPELKGSITAKNGALGLMTMNEVIQPIDLSLRFDGHRVTFDGSASFGGGGVTAKGSADWKEKAITHYDGEVHMHTPSIDSAYYKGAVDADLSLGEFMDQLGVTGKISIHNATCEVPFALLAESGESSANFLTKIDIAIGDNVRLYSSSLYDLMIKGNISMMGHFREPIMTGRVNVEKGTVKINTTEFKIDQANAVWGGTPGSFLPVIHARADTKVGHYNIKAELDGLPGDMKTTFHSDPALNDSQIIMLLTLHQDPTKDKDGSMQGALFNAGLTMLFGNTMQDFLADKIGLDLISITSNLTDYYDNIDDNNDSYYYIKIGKYLFNDFMLTATMGVNNEEKSLGFHYDLNSRVGLSSWYNSNHDSYIGSDWSFKF